MDTQIPTTTPQARQRIVSAIRHLLLGYGALTTVPHHEETNITFVINEGKGWFVARLTNTQAKTLVAAINNGSRRRVSEAAFMALMFYLYNTLHRDGSPATNPNEWPFDNNGTLFNPRGDGVVLVEMEREDLTLLIALLHREYEKWICAYLTPNQR